MCITNHHFDVPKLRRDVLSINYFSILEYNLYMTRINSAIPVQHLTDEHLLAEHREIKRLPYCLERSIKSRSKRRMPSEFCLGTGHVIFFLDKMKFVSRRYKELYAECCKRGFTVTDYSSNFENVSLDHFNDYVPTSNEREVLIKRITERLKNSPKSSWHYCGKKISKEEAIEMLKGWG